MRRFIYAADDFVVNKFFTIDITVQDSHFTTEFFCKGSLMSLENCRIFLQLKNFSANIIYAIEIILHGKICKTFRPDQKIYDLIFRSIKIILLTP